jgi:heterodisulfide reductase subunit A
VAGDRPRVGVFVCNCGINIAGVVDVPAVRDYAATLPFVEYVTDNMYTCSQDTQDSMTEIIKEKNSTGWWWQPVRPRPTNRFSRKP